VVAVGSNCCRKAQSNSSNLHVDVGRMIGIEGSEGKDSSVEKKEMRERPYYYDRDPSSWSFLQLDVDLLGKSKLPCNMHQFSSASSLTRAVALP